jgi:hypothetical protein
MDVSKGKQKVLRVFTAGSLGGSVEGRRKMLEIVMGMAEQSGEADDPIPQSLRVVEYIDCVPGRTAGRTERPIAIITLAHLGELDQPLMLDLCDARRLAEALTAVMTHFGENAATQRDDECFPRKHDPSDEECPVSPLVCPAASPSDRMDRIENSGVLLRVRPQDRTLPSLTFHVLAGCRSGSTVILLIRSEEFGQRVESLVRIDRHQRVHLKGLRKDEQLPRDQWLNLWRVRPGMLLCIGRRRYVKLSATELRRAVGKKMWMSASTAGN